MRHIARSTLIIMASIGAISCGTLNAVDNRQLAEIAEMGEAIVVLKKDGTTQLYGVAEQGKLVASNKCKIGNLPREAYETIPGLAKVAPPSKQRISKDDPELCAGVAPNKAWIHGSYAVSVVKITANPHKCWFCYLDCKANNVCNQVCIPTECK